MPPMGCDGREWSHDGENILSSKNLGAVERHLEEVGAIVVEHWHYYGGCARTHLAFDHFVDFKAYLDSRVKAGDAIDVCPFPTDTATAIARASIRRPKRGREQSHEAAPRPRFPATSSVP